MKADGFYNVYEQERFTEAADEIERLRVLLKNVVGAWDAWDIQTDDGSGFMNLEDVIDTARSALQQKDTE